MSGEAALAAITNGSLDPASEVAIEPGPTGALSTPLRQPVTDPSPQAPEADTRNPESGRQKPGQQSGSILEYQAERVRVGIHAPQPGWLVLMDTPYPGWQAYSEGHRLPIYAANWCGRAVPLRAGYHEVQFRFEPAAVRVGLYVSLTSLMILAGVGAGSLRPRARRRYA